VVQAVVAQVKYQLAVLLELLTKVMQVVMVVILVQDGAVAVVVEHLLLVLMELGMLAVTVYLTQLG
jgi:hypothetical protein